MFRLILLLFIVSNTGLIAQETVLQNLTRKDVQVSYISFSNTVIASEKDNQFRLHGHKLVKSKTGLYVFIDGTGRLYQQIGTDSVTQWTRIDSTTHFGYNIAAFPFSYQDKVYNFGGYGLWRINGQLRVFNKKENTWDIVKLNKEIAFLFDEKSHLLWYDHKKGNIYLGYAIQRNEAVKTEEIDETILDFTVRKLDLNKNEWTDIGMLSSPIKDKIQTVTTITMSPWGQLATLGDKINLIDFENNKLLALNISKPGYQTIFRKKSDHNFYFKDSTLFFGNILNKTLDSIPFSYIDFLDTGIQVFTPIPKAPFYRSTPFLVIGLLIVLGVSLWLLSRKYGVYRKTDVSLTSERKLSTPINTKLFDEQELSLLHLLIHNTESGRLTSIEEINKVLGLIKRNPEIQKKQRSDIMTGINQKYNFVYPNKQAIILKQRSSDDGRSFDYFIAFEDLQSIKSLLPIEAVQ